MPSAKRRIKAAPPPVAAGLFKIIEDPNDLKLGDILYIPHFVRFSNGTASSYDISNGDTNRSDNRASLVANLFGVGGIPGSRFLLATDVRKHDRSATRSVNMPDNIASLLSDDADVGFSIQETNAGSYLTYASWRILKPEDFKVLSLSARDHALTLADENGTRFDLGPQAMVGSVPMRSQWLEDTILALANHLGLREACTRAGRYRSLNEGFKRENQPDKPDDLAHALISIDRGDSFVNMPRWFPDATDGEPTYNWNRSNDDESEKMVLDPVKRAVHDAFQDSSWSVDRENQLITRQRFLPNLLRKGALILRRTGERTMLDEFAAAALDIRARIVARLLRYAAKSLASMRETFDAAVVRYDDLGDRWHNAAGRAVAEAPDMDAILKAFEDVEFQSGTTKYLGKGEQP